MPRPAHGATRRPLLARPGNGYGRALRPGPSPALRRAASGAAGDLDRFLERLHVVVDLVVEESVSA